ncbi:T9SS type A sorting domain-containing protein [Bernardetia sp. ABR2-2B]|uniref:T9SS type A sorting domain-containing protein n=1 Tax=Bernardetia sp. ABR2-2B TaxID=3127472 RepID=UPI0030CB52B9
MKTIKFYFFLVIIYICYVSSVFSQNISLTATTGTPTAGYVDFTAAFNAINAGTHGGIVTLTVNNGFNENGATLNAPPAVGTPYTSVRIQVNLLLFTDAIVRGNGNNPILIFDGAKNVTIDGGVAGTRRLVIVNTKNTGSTTNAIALQISNDAQNIDIQNTKFASGVQAISRGTISFISGSIADLHTVLIRDCEIYDANSTTVGGGFPSRAIVAVNGGNRNIRNVNIATNLIYNYHSSSNAVGYANSDGATGIFLFDDAHSWTIENNRIFQNATRSYNYNTTTSAVRLGTGYGHIIQNNTIGYGSSFSTGNYTISSTTRELRFVGIWLYNQSTTDSTNITGNTIRNFDFTTDSNKNGEISSNPRGVWCGITVSNPTNETTAQTGRIGINNNTIGDPIDNTAPYSIQTNNFQSGGEVVGVYVTHQGNYMSIDNNTLASVATFTNNNSHTSYIFGIDARGNGDKNIRGNILQYLYAGNTSDNNNSGSHVDAMLVFGSGTHSIANNNFLDITSHGTGSFYVSGVLYALQGRNIILGNQIRNIESKGRGITSTDPTFAYGFAGRSATLFGMRVAGTGEQIVGVNIISNLRGNIRANVAAADLGVAAIGLGDNNTVGRAFGNRIYDIQLNQGIATSLSTSGVAGMVVNNAVSQWDVYNNMVSLAPPNNVAVLGIASDGVNNVSRFLFNSVYIGGGTASGSEASGCLYRASNSTITMRNNLLFNERIAGGVANFCLLFRSNGGSITNDYNTYLPRSTTSMVALLQAGGTPAAGDFCPNLAALKAKNVNFDRFSWSHQQASTPTATDLFVNPTLGDLHINTTNQAAWYSSGKGEQNALAFEDIDRDSRSTTVFTGTTDIGADEFDLDRDANPAPQAVQTGTIGAGNTTTYTWADKKIGEITWGAGGTLPTSMNFRYFSGETPPSSNFLNAEFQDGFWLVEPQTGSFSGTDYTVQFDFGPHETGTVAAPSANIILTKRDGGWEFYNHSNTLTPLRSTRDYVSSPKTMTVPGLTTFSDFTLTSEVFPLPVEWLSFDGKLINNKEIKLDWSTISETNHSHFEVERMNTSTKEFMKLGSIYEPNSKDNFKKKYNFVDNEPQVGNNYYRIKQIDEGNIDYSYSNIVEVSYEISAETIFISPNPVSKNRIQVNIPQLESNQGAYLEVYDAIGRKYLSKELVDTKTDIILPQLRKGIYIIVIQMNQKRVSRKIIVE